MLCVFKIALRLKQAKTCSLLDVSNHKRLIQADKITNRLIQVNAKQKNSEFYFKKRCRVKQLYRQRKIYIERRREHVKEDQTITKPSKFKTQLIIQTIQNTVENIYDKLCQIDEQINTYKSSILQAIRLTKMQVSVSKFLSPLAPFSGAIDESFSQWVSKFENYMLLHIYLEQHLEGTALAVFKEFKQETTILEESYSAYKTKLSNEFCVYKNCDIMQIKLMNCKQDENESIVC